MRFTPLHPRFGAQVHDFDLQKGGTTEEVQELRQAYDRYQMLLFRGHGRLSPKRHVEIASWFGPPPPIANDGENFATVLDNKEPAGSFQLPFHSDLTYTEVPVKGISLHPIELPEQPTSTSYVSGIDAWTRLPEAFKQKITPLTARHFCCDSISSIENMPTFSEEQPVRLLHPRTGKAVLFVTQLHADRIIGLEEDESRALLDALFAHLYAPEQQYEHVWQLHDLLIWDNLALQHSRTQRSDPGKGRRRLQRVALAEASYPELIERARRKQAA